MRVPGKRSRDASAYRSTAPEAQQMRGAVAGGTGAVGRPVVGELTAAGHEPVVPARSRGVDLVSGAGLDAAPAGAEAAPRMNTQPVAAREVARHLVDRCSLFLGAWRRSPPDRGWSIWPTWCAGCGGPATSGGWWCR
ncbi:hypothetical protein [Streptomyces sp. NPDC048438]|uniref:hypothetical protein n=1 Tax=Streptomyces sp. NPDC048438 TaxID=3365551 RepID=UPI003723B678